MFGVLAGRSVSAAAELGVADALKDRPLHYTELAKAVGADQRALHRAMRALASVGVFLEPSPGTFALTPVSQLLRSDVPGSSSPKCLPWSRTGVPGPIQRQTVFGTI